MLSDRVAAYVAFIILVALSGCSTEVTLLPE